MVNAKNDTICRNNPTIHLSLYYQIMDIIATRSVNLKMDRLVQCNKKHQHQVMIKV